jgi:hypothetical protein
VTKAPEGTVTVPAVPLAAENFEFATIEETIMRGSYAATAAPLAMGVYVRYHVIAPLVGVFVVVYLYWIFVVPLAAVKSVI